MDGTPSVPVLSRLTLEESRRMAEDRHWPKWSTQCFVHSLGLPVLDACLITPQRGRWLEDAVGVFAELHHSDSVMVRSDGGVEATTYPRGGHTLPLEQAIAWARRALSDDRAVLLLEPANRFTNALSAMIRLDRQGAAGSGGQLTIEVLGAGFDLADFARSGIQPHARVEVCNIQWSQPERLWPHDIRVTEVESPESVRIEARLDFIGAHCLPPGVKSDGVGKAERAREWLLEMGHTELFQEFSLASALRHVAKWHGDAYSIVHGFAYRQWRCIAVGWSKLGAGREVYWDVVDGGHKYGSQH